MDEAARPLVFTASQWLWIARAICAVAFTSLMIVGWDRWPNGGAWLGPLGMIWYDGLHFGTGAVALVSIVVLFAYLIKPSTTTALISYFGVGNWLFMSMLAQGIGC